MNKLTAKLILGLIVSGIGFGWVNFALAENVVLSLSPSTGTFVVDSTFEASIYLDTKGQSINTVELSLKYPPDKLQLVSSSTGKSIIGIWAELPRFNNQTGTIDLTGGVPGGINVSRGLITTLTFRVKSVGSAIVKFNSANILLHDGNGTEVLNQTQNSVYNLVLPPPAGPVVVSDTHADQTVWNKNPNASLRWGDESGLEGFSYMISDSPSDIPDDIAEGTKQDVVYRNLSDGRHYFHIKGMRDKQWGGTTHFALNIDTQPPAEFKLEFIPAAKTSRRQPVIQFETSDNASGVDHYELKIVSLSTPANSNGPQALSQELFIEATSPFITNQMENGRYDVLVRAYDDAGNYREVVSRLQIVPALFRNIGEKGLEFRSALVVSWWMIWAIGILLLGSLCFVAYKVLHHHRNIHQQLSQKALPGDLQQQLSELQQYRDKFGKIGMLILAISFSLFVGQKALAQTNSVLFPPLITTVSKDISNEDIFYVGGKTDVKDAEVILFLGNQESGETVQETIPTDKNGEWFYRHDTFLEPGKYQVWGQTKVENQLSAPSPQVLINVEKTAFAFGLTKLGYTTVYSVLLLVLAVAILSLVLFILYHYRHSRRKHKLLMNEVTEAEASIRRGFAVLNRDIKSELDLISHLKMNKSLSEEGHKREEQLLKDMEEIEQYLSKEIWDIEEVERNN